MPPTLGCKGKSKRCRPFRSDDLGETIERTCAATTNLTTSSDPTP
jgi:hypothetical protein